MGPAGAAADGAPLVHPELGTNVAEELPELPRPDVDEIFASAAHVVTETFEQHRYLPVPMETRGLVASWDRWSDRLELVISCQGVHEVRLFFSRYFDVPEDQPRASSAARSSFIGRKSADLTHPLSVLEDCALVSKEPDIFRRGRWTYRVTEPLISFYEAVMRPEWFRLESGQAEAVWRDRRADFFSRVVGPHVETLCRLFAQTAGADLFGGPVGDVGSGIVNDPVSRTQIEIDVAVLAPAEPGRPQRILSLGEVKWGEVMSRRHVERLGRARDLLSSSFDTADCVLACYSAGGFTDDLRSARDPRLGLITLEDLYRPPA